MSTIVRVPLVVLLAAALSSAAARAAPPQEEPRTGTDREAQAYLAEFANCVVAQKSYRTKVDAFLRIVPGSEGYGAAALKAADLHCLDAAAQRSHARITMKMAPNIFRDSLYPALYKRDFGRSGPPAGISAAPAASLSTEFDGDVAALPPDYRPRRALGDCVVRAAPQAANALLTANPLDRAEDAAVEGLKPAIASCMVAGQTIRMNRAALRAILGEAAYKLAHAVPNGT